MRLLKLAPKVLLRLREGKITERHARAVLSLSDSEQEALIEQVIAQKLNVKQTEDRVRLKRGPKSQSTKPSLCTRCPQARDEVGKSIQAIQQTGLHVEHKDKDHEDYYEIKIRIYKR